MVPLRSLEGSAIPTLHCWHRFCPSLHSERVPLALRQGSHIESRPLRVAVVPVAWRKPHFFGAMSVRDRQTQEYPEKQASDRNSGSHSTPWRKVFYRRAPRRRTGLPTAPVTLLP